ncbi:MAG: hypothetical protein WCA89_09660, partial [Terracidiphilus sp.]
ACEFVRTIHGNSFSVSSASLNTGGHNETETKFVARQYGESLQLEGSTSSDINENEKYRAADCKAGSGPIAAI